MPLKPLHHDFQMYQFHSGHPLQIQNLTFTLSTPEPILIIDSLKTIYRTISLAEFEKCNRVSKRYQCHFEKVYSKSTHNNCLAKLFLGDFHLIHDVCPFVIASQEKETIQEIALNKFTIRSPRAPTQVTINCKDPQENSELVVIGTQTLKLPSHTSCLMNTKNHVIFSSVSIVMDDMLFYKPSTYTLEQFLFDGLSHQDVPALTSLVRELQEQEPLKDLSIRDVQVAWRKNKDSQFNFFMRFKVELVILAILTLLAVTLPVYCFFKWKKNLTNREQERRVMFQERPIVIAPPAQQALEMQPLVRQGTLSRDISPRPTAPPLRQAPNLNLSLSDLPHVIGQ